MGLDICVFKPQILDGITPEEFEENDGYFFNLNENPELEIFASMAFNKTNSYYDLETAVKELGYDLDQVELTGYGFGKKAEFDFKDKQGKKFTVVNPSTIEKVERCIACTEVGYQRKGANSQFYEDGMWDSPSVTKMSVLTEHWNKYFSENTPESKGGFGYGVEFRMENDEMKKYFKENIIDKFVENETFVRYC